MLFICNFLKFFYQDPVLILIIHSVPCGSDDSTLRIGSLSFWSSSETWYLKNTQTEILNFVDAGTEIFGSLILSKGKGPYKQNIKIPLF